MGLHIMESYNGCEALYNA